MSKSLRKLILDTFPLLPSTNYKLSDAIAEDDYGDRSYTFEENWKSWIEIENWQIVKCHVLFCYAPPAAAAYLIPRYMLFVLDEIEDKLHPAYQGYSSGESTVWHLQRLKKAGYINSCLEAAQIETIELFLGEIQLDEDYRVTFEVGDE